MTISLKGRVALITGVSRRTGIGYAIAHRLASLGADLFLHSFSPYDKTQDVVMEENEAGLIVRGLGPFGVSVEQMESDFIDPAAPSQVIGAALRRFGRIDILILNHTRDTLKTLEELTAEEIDRHLMVNVRAALLLIQHFAKHYEGKSGGRVVLLTSGQHLGPMPHAAYVASKGALHQLTSSLSDSLIRKGITVNTVNPGPTLTYTPSTEVHDDVLRKMPQGRWGQPDDAARLIGWLVSDEASWVTGQVINSEGGFRRG